MGNAASNVDPTSQLPTGATVPLTSGTMPMDGARRTIQFEQGFRTEDATGGPVGATGNQVSPIEMSGFVPLKLTIPASAIRLRMRTDGNIIFGSNVNLNVGNGPGSEMPGSGYFPLTDDDGVVEIPVTGMAALYVVAPGMACNLYFYFLVLSDL